MLAARFALRSSVNVLDVGSGSGANVRALASLLPEKQHWTLVDNDAAMLASARQALTAWADRARADGETLVLSKDRAEIRIAFRIADLAGDLDSIFGTPADLVTASAFFDLVSEDFARRFVRAVAAQGAVLHSALTYNGVQRWTPHRPDDNRMTAAFHRHQLGDKGFGPALGPMASSFLSDQLQMAGYSVIEGESPWVLDRNDRMLIEELVRGHAFAVADTGAIDGATLEKWVRVVRSGAVVGHTDTFAVPTDRVAIS